MLKVLIAENMTVVREGLVSAPGREPGIEAVAQTSRSTCAPPGRRARPATC
ncbi:hypothetical protein AB0467_13595 [Streptomyces sp. NPDC052095]|uniref:hypothetical protein n=1 Tax=unclassified Streptomyces TaxID=2593676 RepID=UPI00344FC43F